MKTRTPLDRVRLMRATRRCISCGERYPRRSPNCPLCKAKRGLEGLPPDALWKLGGMGGDAGGV